MGGIKPSVAQTAAAASFCVSKEPLSRSPAINMRGRRALSYSNGRHTIKPISSALRKHLCLHLRARAEQFLVAGAGSEINSGAGRAAAAPRFGRARQLTERCFSPADKPQVRVSQNYPVQGLTREGEPLELTCAAFGKPQ